MKRTIGLLILLLWVVFANANEIDKLSTKEDVQKFLIAKIDTNWKYVSPFEDNKAHTEKFVKAGFLKMDIDSNGLTDLLVYGQDCFIVLDIGNGQYDLFGSYTAPYNMNIISYEQFVDILVVENTPLFVVKKIIWQDGSMTYAPKNDTIIFRFGGFMEYNLTPDYLDVAEINFKLYDGYGGTRLEMNIDASKWVTYEAYEDNEHRILVGEVDSLDFRILTQTINYVKTISHNNHYHNPDVIDMSSYEIKVKYSNGQIKKIIDGQPNLYGKLMNLKQKLYELH